MTTDKKIINADEIRKETSTLEVINAMSPELEFTRSGTNHKACCPFHTEKTASFNINTSKNYYKCFGCGVGGDGVSYLMEKCGMTFPEAVEKCAEISRLKVRYKEGVEVTRWKQKKAKDKAKKESLGAYFLQVLDYYKNSKSTFPEKKVDDVKCLEVAGRLYLPETVKKFKMMPPEENGYLSKHAISEKWDMEKLREIGIVNCKDGGEYYDMMRGRTIFTISDHLGTPISMAGRLMEKADKRPKYINLKDSLLYHKRRVLYGFDLARKAIHESRTLYLTEGYTDVATCSEYGLENVAATCGTALTDEQCKLMQRFGVETVVIFRDGDSAGLKAAKNDVVTLIKAGMVPQILLCDDGHDPDSQVRHLGVKGFKRFQEKKEDGLIWLVMSDYKKGDPHSEAETIELAALLISYLPDTLRETYLRAFCPSRLGSVRKTIEKRIAQELAKRKPQKKNRNELESEQLAEAIDYGIFRRDNAYYRYEYDEGDGTKLSNFVIESKYLIKDKESPARIVSIKNIYGHTAIMNVDTSVFGTQQKVVDEVAKHGNFIFEASLKKPDFNAIVKMIYDEMNDSSAYSVVALGQHVRGFYVWCNGITTQKGEFIEADEMGLVNYDGTKFLLPGRGFDAEDDNFDLSAEDNRYIKQFRYVEGECPTFSEWNKDFIGVYGDNGMMGIAWYMAVLFRDFIFPINKSFPLMNGFGKKGKGKSTMMWSLGYMFGDARLAGILGVSTYTSFFRSFMQVSNAVVWWDEFHDKLDLKTWIKPMMGIYDGNGRNLGNITSSHGTSQTPIRAGFSYTGQDMPMNNDGALASRSITLHFNYERTPEAEQKLNALRKVEQKGVLSQITAHILTFREKIERQWDIMYSEVKNDVVHHMESRLIDVGSVESRTLQNHIIPLTVFRILESELEFCFTYLDLVHYTTTLIENQSNLISNNDDTGTFWKVIEFLTNTGTIKHDREILVEMRSSVRRKKGRKEIELVTFPEDKKVLFVRMNDVYQHYARQVVQVRKDALEQATLEHYLRNHPAYLGEIKAKRFEKNSRTVKAWMFDLEKVENAEFILTIEAISSSFYEGEMNGEDDITSERFKPK